jgi:ABC-type uncharacterized transport system involved in gliding motility auxiliary subunit
MKRQKYTKGQVLLWAIIFFAVMGLVGTIDSDSQVDFIDHDIRPDLIRVAGR